MKLSKISAVVLLISIMLSALCVPASAATLKFQPKVESGCICGTDLKTPQTAFRDIFGSRALEIYDNDRKAVPVDSQVNMGTGFTVKVDNRVFYNLVVMGDVNGDGELTPMDYVLVKRAVMGTYKLNSVALRAAEVADGEELRSINYIKIKRAYFGTYDINAPYACEPYESTKPDDGWSKNWV